MFTYTAYLLVNFDTENNYNVGFLITPFAKSYFQESKEKGARHF
jgi:hypothetical protein